MVTAAHCEVVVGDSVHLHRHDMYDYAEPGAERLEVAEVVRHFQSKRPLWIFGHSMGTSTVAAFLGSNRSEIDLLQGYIVAGTHRGEAIIQSRSHGIEEILIDTAATFILKT